MIFKSINPNSLFNESFVKYHKNIQTPLLFHHSFSINVPENDSLEDVIILHFIGNVADNNL